MKYTNQLALLFITVLGFSSCKKDELKTYSIASLNVTTAVISGGNVKLNTNERDSAKAYNAKLFTINAGNSAIKLFPTRSPDTLYFNGTQVTADRDIYSIFLFGQAPTFENILVKESIPAPYPDSSIGVRVINLSPNSTPVNITLASDNTTNIVTSLAYKQITGFLKLPVLGSTTASQATFQARDAVGTLLASYAIPLNNAVSTYPGISVRLSRFKNITLVIKGLQGTTGSDGFGIFPVANY